MTETHDFSMFSESELRSRYPKEFRAWRAMRKRCASKSSKYYGARGITVCDRWQHDFRAFLTDMGPAPSPGHSLDRYPDGTGNYQPGNVRWATLSEQQINTCKAVFIEHDGKRLCISEWVRLTGMQHATIVDRYRRGLSPAECLTPEYNSGGKAVHLTYAGKCQSLSDWSRETGIPVGTIAWRHGQGWSPAECLDGAYRRKRRHQNNKESAA